jgi:hypothetical protein
MTASTPAHDTNNHRPSRSSPPNARHGRRHTAKISAADTIRNHATPNTSTRANSNTANDGPR